MGRDGMVFSYHTGILLRRLWEDYWNIKCTRALFFRVVFSQVALVVRNQLASAGDAGGLSSIPGSARSPGGGNGLPLQCSCLENSVERGVLQATVHGVTESDTTEWLSTHKSRKCKSVCLSVDFCSVEAITLLLLLLLLLLSRFSRVRPCVTS